MSHTVTFNEREVPYLREYGKSLFSELNDKAPDQTEKFKTRITYKGAASVPRRELIHDFYLLLNGREIAVHKDKIEQLEQFEVDDLDKLILTFSNPISISNFLRPETFEITLDSLDPKENDNLFRQIAFTEVRNERFKHSSLLTYYFENYSLFLTNLEHQYTKFFSDYLDIPINFFYPKSSFTLLGGRYSFGVGTKIEIVSQ